MSSRQGYLINNVNPASVKSNEFDVRAGVVRLFAANLGADIPLEVWVGGDDTGLWVPLARNGNPVVLNDNNNVYVEMVSGAYRVNPADAGDNAQVWFEEEFCEDGDNRTIYTYVTGGGSNGGGTPFTLNTQSSTSINLYGSGTSGDPLGAEGILDTTVGNQLTITSNGFLVPKIVSISTIPDFTTTLGTITANGASGASTSFTDGYVSWANYTVQFDEPTGSISINVPTTVTDNSGHVLTLRTCTGTAQIIYNSEIYYSIFQGTDNILTTRNPNDTVATGLNANVFIQAIYSL